MSGDLGNVIGQRGEDIFRLAITDFRASARPLFRAAFLGDKWPVVDYYVELLNVRGCRAGMFVQVKSTTSAIPAGAAELPLKVPLAKCEQLYRVPGPTYIAAVHEPTCAVYMKSVHARPTRQISGVSLANSLAGANLTALYDEVKRFWLGTNSKPASSVFT